MRELFYIVLFPCLVILIGLVSQPAAALIFMGLLLYFVGMIASAVLRSPADQQHYEPRTDPEPPLAPPRN